MSIAMLLQLRRYRAFTGDSSGPPQSYSGLSVVVFRIVRYDSRTLSAQEIPRHAAARVVEALADTRIVAVEGPRQAGKSTLCTKLASERGMRIVTLDDANTRRGAIDDPQGFTAALGGRAFIDEPHGVPRSGRPVCSE